MGNQYNTIGDGHENSNKILFNKPDPRAAALARIDPLSATDSEEAVDEVRRQNAARQLANMRYSEKSSKKKSSTRKGAGKGTIKGKRKGTRKASMRSLNNFSTGLRSPSSSSRSSQESSETEYPLGVTGSMIGQDTLSIKQEIELLGIIDNIESDFPDAFKQTNPMQTPLTLDPTLDDHLNTLYERVADIENTVTDEANKYKDLLARIEQCYKKNYKIYNSGHINGKILSYGNYKIGPKGKQKLIRVDKSGYVKNPAMTPVDEEINRRSTQYVIPNSNEYDEYALSLLIIWYKNRTRMVDDREKNLMKAWLDSANRDYKIKFVKTLLLDTMGNPPPSDGKLESATECRDLVVSNAEDSMIQSVKTFLDTFNRLYPSFKYISMILYGLLNNVHTRSKTLNYSSRIPIIILIYHLIEIVIKQSHESTSENFIKARDQLREHYLQLLNYYNINKEIADKKFEIFSNKFKNIVNNITTLVTERGLGTVIANMLHEGLDILAFILVSPQAEQERREQGRIFLALHATIDTISGVTNAAEMIVGRATKILKYLLGQDVRTDPMRGVSSSSGAVSASSRPNFSSRFTPRRRDNVTNATTSNKRIRYFEQLRTASIDGVKMPPPPPKGLFPKNRKPTPTLLAGIPGPDPLTRSENVKPKSNKSKKRPNSSSGSNNNKREKKKSRKKK